VLRAFAEAMAPGLGPLPAAGRDVDVTGPIAGYVAGMPRRERRQIALALRAFDWLPFPWRFSRASLDARMDFLARLEGTRRSLIQDLLLFLKILVGLGYGREPSVTAAIGYEMRCEVRNGSAAPAAAVPEAPLGDLTPPRGGEDCDVAIVGTGAGGAVAAAVLAEAGLDVVVIDAGRYLDRLTYPTDPLEGLAALYRDNGLTICEGKPSIPLPIGRAVGGTTVINSGTCFRAPDAVLRKWREAFGIEWATDLEGEYGAAEEFLHVAPVDPERMGRNGQLVMEGAAALGLSHGPISRNAGTCFRCSSCPIGCRLDAKRAMHVSYLPRAVAAGARVREGTEARRVILEDGRAVGVECAVPSPVAATNGRPAPPRGFELRARKAVIVAGGAVGTPELLLRSRIAHPELGRNLHIHPAAWIGARFDEEVRGWDGVMQSYYVDEWQAELGLLMEATFTPLAFGAQWLPGTGREHMERVLNYDHIGSNGVHLSDASSGRVGIAASGDVRVSYRLGRSDARKLTFGIARAAEIFFAAGAREVYSQVRGMPVIGPGGVAAFEAADPEPAALRLEAFHPMSTARMDADPRAGVTDTDGAVHGTPGLYVADGSLLPSSIGVNPMMTIIAMAARVASQLAERVG
jgi:choline dehydrogenase-like flavoprotein